MRFEARKVIANLREPGQSPSAADVLAEPSSSAARSARA